MEDILCPVPGEGWDPVIPPGEKEKWQKEKAKDSH